MAEENYPQGFDSSYSSQNNVPSGDIGLEDGYAYRDDHPFPSLNLAQSAEADTQAALEGLFSGPLDTIGSRGTTHSPDPNLDPALLTPGEQESGMQQEERKRKPGTSRINMLARGGACEFCKRRKLKCTAEEPSCAACLKIGKECVYSQKKQRSKVRQLEDRLEELEERLLENRKASASAPDAQGDAQDGRSASIPVMSDTMPTSNPELNGFWDRFANIHQTSADGGFTFPTDLTGWGLGNVNLGAGQNMETTLMTLADAAASDVDVSSSHVWEGMSEVAIASEIVKGVEGEKGIGEKIVGHLLQLFVNPQSAPSLHHIVNPATFLSRLLPTSTSPPHPALMLALMPFLLPLSPSLALSNPERARKILDKLDTPARLHSQHALAVADPRILDIVAANTIRTLSCIECGRLVEAWGEVNGAVSLAWATGLGKLGGVGERFLPTLPLDAASLERRDREAKIREIRFKAALVEPPKSGKELGQRIHLFWQVYLMDKGPSVGWGFPALINDDEVTTPFPQDGYDTTAALSDTSTIIDLMEGRAYTGATDSDYCSQIKALCLFNRSSRLFDVASAVATPEKTAQLKQVILGYMASLPPLPPVFGQKLGPKSQTWQMLHLAVFFVCLKEELDLPPGSPPPEIMKLIDEAIESVEKAVQAVEAVYLTGALDLGIDITGPGAWGPAGRSIFRLAMRLEREGRDEGRSGRLRSAGQKLIQACHTVGKRIPAGKIMAQKLENNARGADEAIGMWERNDILG